MFTHCFLSTKEYSFEVLIVEAIRIMIVNVV